MLKFIDNRYRDGTNAAILNAPGLTWEVRPARYGPAQEHRAELLLHRASPRSVTLAGVYYTELEAQVAALHTPDVAHLLPEQGDVSEHLRPLARALKDAVQLAAQQEPRARHLRGLSVAQDWVSVTENGRHVYYEPLLRIDVIEAPDQGFIDFHDAVRVAVRRAVDRMQENDVLPAVPRVALLFHRLHAPTLSDTLGSFPRAGTLDTTGANDDRR